MAPRTSVIGLLFSSSLIAAHPQNAATSGQADALQPPDIYRKAAPAVVSVVVSGRDGKPIKAGSGVITDTAGRVLTNYHVVEGGTFFEVSVSRGERIASTFSARPAACAPEHDLAELELQSPIRLRAARKAAGDPEIGSRVYAIGSPLQLEGTLTEGLVSQLRKLGNQKLIQTTAAISSGSSGGGLFNSRAELVGITTLSISGGQNLNFAVSLTSLRALTSCYKFPLRTEKITATKPQSPSSPIQLPCKTPALEVTLGRISSDTSESNPSEKGVSVWAWITNTGCQKVNDLEIVFWLYDTVTNADVKSVPWQTNEIKSRDWRCDLCPSRRTR